MGPQIVKRALGKASNDDIVQELRSQIIHAWRHGSLLGIACGNGPLKLNEF